MSAPSKILKNKLKNLIYFFLNFFSRPSHGQASVLMYHSIDHNYVFFTVKPRDFKWQMKYLSQKNYNIVFLRELVEMIKKREDMLPKSIALTFDDGYEDFYRNAFPVLKGLNFKATVFLTPGFVGGRMTNSGGEPLKVLSWNQILEMYQSELVEFEPHAKTHLTLSEISPALAREEILDSKKELELRLGRGSAIFAYPRGSYNESVISLLKECGFKCAVTVREGLVKSGDDLFALKRNSIDSSVSRSQFKGKLGRSVEIFNKFFRK